MNYAVIKKTDIANGDGVRVSIWVSGCPIHCEGYFNKDLWDFTYGKPFTDGRTRCPIEEHYALPKDGYCHLWEKRNVTDDDYPERRTDD